MQAEMLEAGDFSRGLGSHWASKIAYDIYAIRYAPNPTRKPNQYPETTVQLTSEYWIWESKSAVVRICFWKVP